MRLFIKINRRRLLVATGVAVAVLTVIVVGAHLAVGAAGDGKCFSDAMAVPARPVAMLLGCPKYDSWSHGPSRYYWNRVEAAAALYRAGRCETILVSSDIDAPGMMADVEAAGVPRAHLCCDPLGVRTRDSFIRAERTFGIRAGIVVSQRYHNERSLYIAEELGQSWVGYDAAEVSGAVWWRAHYRECLARVKAVLDRYVLKPDAAR